VATSASHCSKGRSTRDFVRTVLRATARPAQIAGLQGTIGTLRAGANADLAILELRDGNFEFHDTDGNPVSGKRRLIAQLTQRRPRLSRGTGGITA
jgi:dihydroorotase